MNQAAARRYEAIGILSMLYLPYDDDGTVAYEMSDLNPAHVSENIRKLAQLGRTARWQGRISQWAGMVDEQTEPKGLRWAFLQGMIYASHAAI